MIAILQLGMRINPDSINYIWNFEIWNFEIYLVFSYITNAFSLVG